MNQKYGSNPVFLIFPPRMKEIQDKLFKFWEKNQMELSTSSTLLAVSGGIDSMLLAELFLSNNFQFAIAHVNYQLRGNASDRDAAFVSNWADNHGIKFYLKIDNLGKGIESNIQIAARNSRYEWFDKLLEKNGYTFLATAHHLQDSIETSLINWGRGTGLKGLAGIPPKRNYIIRPLLCLNPQEVKVLCNHYQVKWREDESNLERKYLRNKIRHEVIPQLVNIFPNYYQTQQKTKLNIESDYRLIEELLAGYKSKLIYQEKDLTKLDLSIVENHPEKNHLLFYILKPWEFSLAQIEQFWIGYPNSETKNFSTQIAIGNLKNKVLVLTKNLNQIIESYAINSANTVIKANCGSIEFEIVNTPNKFENLPNEAYFDLEKIQWPLTLRSWKKGDRFQPFGMNGKHQKIQDFFSNKKFSRHQKNTQLLLLNGENIIWILGHRTSNDCKVQSDQQKCLKAIWKKV